MRYYRFGWCAWNLDAAWEMVRGRTPSSMPVEPVDITKRHTLPLNVSANALETADMSKPALIAMLPFDDGSGQRFFMIDGFDQWWTASVRRIARIPVHVLTVRESLELMFSGRDWMQHRAAESARSKAAD